MKKFLSVILSLIIITCTLFTSGIKTEASTDLSKANLLNTYGTVFGRVGTAMGADQMFNSSTVNYAKTQFNSVTPENEMKPDGILGSYANLISVADAKALGYYIPDGYTESTVPRLNFSTVDKMLQTCYENGMGMRGHTLVWHSQTPSWLFKTNYNDSNGYVSQSVMNARMEFYIKSVMGHAFSSKYGSVIYAWDVVNEYFHATNSGWQQIYGSNLGTHPSFVKSAFQYAYEALKTYGLTDKVKLFYNDYNEYMEVDDIINLINYINSDSKVCAGIGMQSHLDTNFPSADYYKSALQSFVKAGLEIEITELDVTCSDQSVQAKYYYDLMSAILSVKKAGGNISAIVWWGLSDDCSWRGSQKPLLFSSIGVAKSAYTSVLQAFFDAGYDINNPAITPTPSPTPTPQKPISAFTQIEAEDYSSQSGIKTEDCNEGGQDIGFIENNDYAVYKNVDFGGGSSSFQARVASAASGGNIEIRLDSIDGKLVGTCPVAGTGGWQTWTNATCSVSGVSGVHDLYLKFTGGSSYLLNINWFKFTGEVIPTPTPTSTPTPTPTPVTTLKVSPTSVTFNKTAQADLTVGITDSNKAANPIVSVYNGTTRVVPCTQEQLTSTTTGYSCKILKSYLNTLPVGANTVTFNFKNGKTLKLTINVVTSNITTTPTSSTFTKAAPADIIVAITAPNKATDPIVGVYKGTTRVVAGTQEQIATKTTGYSCKILQSYLNTLPVGANTITFKFKSGSTVDFIVNIK